MMRWLSLFFYVFLSATATTEIYTYCHTLSLHAPLPISPIMLDDKQHRIRLIVPNLMGYGSQIKPPAYHAFFDPARGVPKPSDGRPVREGLRPVFVWPASAWAVGIRERPRFGSWRWGVWPRLRLEERWVGKESVCTGRSRGAPIL